MQNFYKFHGIPNPTLNQGLVKIRVADPTVLSKFFLGLLAEIVSIPAQKLNTVL
jgi:hypothetical protein